MEVPFAHKLALWPVKDEIPCLQSITHACHTQETYNPEWNNRWFKVHFKKRITQLYFYFELILNKHQEYKFTKQF